MITVKVRHVNEPRPVTLMTWPAEHLDQILPLLARWGIFNPDTDVEVHSDLTAQLVANEREAFLEVVYGSDEP